MPEVKKIHKTIPEEYIFFQIFVTYIYFDKTGPEGREVVSDYRQYLLGLTCTKLVADLLYKKETVVDHHIQPCYTSPSPPPPPRL